MTKRFKFLKKGYKSTNGSQKWLLNKWYKHDGELRLCQSGFHCSKGIYQAFSFVQGEILAEVEVRGKHLSDKQKEVWSEMRVVKSWKWQKKDSVLFSCFAARLVLKNYEKLYPNDLRVREAIEAVENYVKFPTEKNRKAAWSAENAAWSAAWSAARSAENAVWSAAWSAENAARSAARSAENAARSAARSAENAAWSAAWSAETVARSVTWGVAWSAARSAENAARSAENAARSAENAIYKKLDKWMLNNLKNLRPLKGLK